MLLQRTLELTSTFFEFLSFWFNLHIYLYFLKTSESLPVNPITIIKNKDHPEFIAITSLQSCLEIVHDFFAFSKGFVFPEAKQYTSEMWYFWCYTEFLKVRSVRQSQLLGLLNFKLLQYTLYHKWWNAASGMGSIWWIQHID